MCFWALSFCLYDFYVFVHITVLYLELSRTSTMELFCEKNYRLLAVNYFRKKSPLHMLDWALNTPLC